MKLDSPHVGKYHATTSEASTSATNSQLSFSAHSFKSFIMKYAYALLALAAAVTAAPTANPDAAPEAAPEAAPTEQSYGKYANYGMLTLNLHHIFRIY